MKTAKFKAIANATPDTKVQWQVSTDGGNTFKNLTGPISTTTTYVNGINTATLSFKADGGEDQNEYQALFINPLDANKPTATTAATLTVTNYAPVVTTQPTSHQAVKTGATITLSADARANPGPVTVQWEFSMNGGAFHPVPASNSSGTTDTLTITAKGTPGVERFEAVFTDSAGKTTSKVAVVDVDIAPKVATQPKDTSVSAGKNAKFTATATASPDATVQWEVELAGDTNFTPIRGATSTILIVSHVTDLDSGNKYEAVFTNPVGMDTTDPATLTVT
jgi:hypothetical protein